jgi:hypothetical protein
MRIQATDQRQRAWSDLCDATGESTKSKSIDLAVRYYLRMAGGTTAVPTGAVDELLRLAVDEGSVTATEIADVLGCEEYPIDVETTVATGRPEVRDAD